VHYTTIINKPLLLHLVGYLYYWQMGFNSVFKGLKTKMQGLFRPVLPDARKKHILFINFSILSFRALPVCPFDTED